MVRLSFDVALRYDFGAPSDFLFNIHAAQTPAQQVIEEHVATTAPDEPLVFVEPQFGNRLLRVRAATGPLEVKYRATVDVAQHIADPGEIPETPVGQLPPEVIAYLLPSRYCQSDRMAKLACWEFGRLERGYARVEAVRQWVHARTRFAIGTSTPATTALDTLTEHAGVCRDFAHLMISLCRALNIPARFVTGIDYGADPALGPVDFHAYVEAFVGDRWYLFDPTDITPTTGLLRIGTGRDAADVPFALIFGDVRCAMPAISITALVDSARGYVAPERTTAAVSTAGPMDHPPVLQLLPPNAVHPMREPMGIVQLPRRCG